MSTTKNKVENRIRELVPELKELENEVATNNRGTTFIGKKVLPDILLNHILMAIYKSKAEDLSFNYIINTGGQIMRDTEEGSFSIQPREIWYKLDKSFSDQSEELYLFLLDILTNH